MKGKIEALHLSRRALVYVRQSSLAQVREHPESTKRQYGLVERARGLGWAPEAIEVVDEDQARSAASTEGRSGFARLADAVAHGEVGGVFAVEVSRLSRSSEDWRRLLSLCGVAGVVVATKSACTIRATLTTSCSWSSRAQCRKRSCTGSACAWWAPASTK